MCGKKCSWLRVLLVLGNGGANRNGRLMVVAIQGYGRGDGEGIIALVTVILQVVTAGKVAAGNCGVRWQFT